MIVDNEKILSALMTEYAQYDSVVIPIYSDMSKHRVHNRLSLLYICIIDINKTYTLLVNHSDKLFDIDNLNFINNDRVKYTYSTGIKNSINIDALYYMTNLCNIDKEELYTESHKYFYNRYWRLDNVNDIIPAYKHEEYCNKIRDKILPLLNNKDKEGFAEYNTKVIPAFKTIENAGLATSEGYEFTKYNLWTITGRPSNSYNGINYAALNKDDGTREKYISRFDKGKLVEFDFDAYHLRLIAKMINYNFPDTSIHAYLGKFYFDKQIITKDEYNESKAITFKILYGGVPKEFESIPFFSEVKQYIFKIWDIYKSKGYVETPIFKRKLYADNLTNRDIKPQTLFNYLIQAMETEQNVLIIEDIQNKIKEYQSKLILYTYDALLFDLHPDETSLLSLIKESMLYPVKCKTGHNYNKMDSYTFELGE
tara:strand:- start:68 stop:1342 length:1275 start_codon:yes stop_codon:yes gene_type:complete